MQLPWAAEYFEPLPGSRTPIIGHLSNYGIELLQVQMAYYQRDKQNAARG